MYDITGKPGADCFCNWCQMRYSSNRKYGGFVAFIDPLYQPGVSTLYGIECCQHCYRILMNLDVSVRHQLACGGALNEAFPMYSNETFSLLDSFQSGEYPAPVNMSKRVEVPVIPSSRVRCFSSLQGAVHLSLTRWASTKGAPYYSDERWRKVKFTQVQLDPSLPGLPTKRGRRKPSLRNPRQYSLV